MNIDELTTELMESNDITLELIFEDPLNYLYYLNYDDDTDFLDLEKLLLFAIKDINKHSNDKCPISYGTALKSVIQKLSNNF